MPNESNRNTIVFVVCAAVLLVAYNTFVLGPAEKRRQLEAQRAAAAAPAQTRPGMPAVPGVAPATVYVSRTQALAATPRVRIDNPALTGSIALKGARIDDLFLKGYRETIKPNSPLVELFRPDGADRAYFAQFGWVGANVPGLPGAATLWTAQSGATLSPGHPVVLTYESGAGLTFTRQIEVDDRYLFTVTDTVANHGAQAVSLAPYASVQRQGLPQDPSRTAHEGGVGMLNSKLVQPGYKDWKKKGDIQTASTGGWLGVTEKYWLAALIPPQDQPITGQFRVTPSNGQDVYETDYVAPARIIAPGTAASQTSRLFAGAKIAPVLRDYGKALNVTKLDNAVDWGLFWFCTQPIFLVLEFFYKLVGNFGIAILLLTVAVKLLFFPLANKSYESITKMKKVQPELEQIKKRNKDDPAKQQQEMMALYQKEKINPFMGCLPLLIQLPVFYSLYKVLSVTIEMRQAPFFGWIQDLSARDPTTIFNLFGALPYHPAVIPLIGGFLDGPLHIGIWSLAYAGTMWLTQAMSPPSGVDPTQQKIFQLMPLFMTFVLSQVAVGLMIYWTWSNVLSILQQYLIMRRFKVDNPIDSLLARLKPKASGAAG